MPTLLRNGIIALAICALLVIICYHWIDKPVAFLMYHYDFRHSAITPTLNTFTYISASLASSVIFLYLYFLIRFSFNKTTRLDWVVLAVANSITIAMYLKNTFKDVFGRYWPQTWVNNNPSLIKDNAYGFHFFHSGEAFGSFPSGHTCLIVAAMTVLWLTYPRFRWLYATLIALVIIGLLGLNYHFVSDIIAGGTLGGLTGYYVVRISNLNRNVKSFRLAFNNLIKRRLRFS